MYEKIMLLDLKLQVQRRLELLEQQIILSAPDDDDAAFDFLIKKSASFRDTLEKINQRLKEL